VADLLNYKTKRAMYRRFSTGFGVYMIAQLCESAQCSVQQVLSVLRAQHRRQHISSLS
jgi:hypothetical protein